METNIQQAIADYRAAGRHAIAERPELQAMIDRFDQATPEQKRTAFEAILALAIGASIAGGKEHLVQEFAQQ